MNKHSSPIPTIIQQAHSYHRIPLFNLSQAPSLTIYPHSCFIDCNHLLLIRSSSITSFILTIVFV